MLPSRPDGAHRAAELSPARGEFCPLLRVGARTGNYRPGMKSTDMTRVRRFQTSIIATCAAVAVAIASTSPASAVATSDSAASDSIETALSRVESFDSTLLLDTHVTDAATIIGSSSHLGGGAVQIPSRLSDGVRIAGDTQIGVSLPFDEKAEDAVALESGAIAFPGSDSSNVVIVSEAGVQMLTTIENENAPTRFTYEVSLGPGQRLGAIDNDVVVLNGDGSVELAVAPAWAVDANGREIPTSYEIEGNTVTQVVDHTDVNTAYPVVADPVWIAPWVYRCLLGIGLSGPQITAAFASGTIWGGLGSAALACVRGR